MTPTPMKERPILFSAPMARAILAGQKTQTRRLVTPGPGPEFWDHAGYELRPQASGVYRFHFRDSGEVAKYSPDVAGRYGIPGDRLWVKETWRTCASLDHVKPRNLANGTPLKFEAGGATVDNPEVWVWGRGRPSIFMRRWMSRITLGIESVRAKMGRGFGTSGAIYPVGCG